MTLISKSRTYFVLLAKGDINKVMNPACMSGIRTPGRRMMSPKVANYGVRLSTWIKLVPGKYNGSMLMIMMIKVKSIEKSKQFVTLNYPFDSIPESFQGLIP